MNATEAVLPQGRRRFGDPFYFWMSLAMAAVFVAGFTRTVPGDFMNSPALPLLLHLHGAVFTLWVFLIVAQPALIASGSLRWHRRIGLMGVALALAMVVMGVVATVVSIHLQRVPVIFPPAVFLSMNLIGILVFGAIVAWGYARRRNPGWHKRLMLCATISILTPGLARALPVPAFGAAAPLIIFGTALAFAAAGMIHDRRTLGRVHPAWYAGAGVILLTDLAIPLFAATPVATGWVGLIQAY